MDLVSHLVRASRREFVRRAVGVGLLVALVLLQGCGRRKRVRVDVGAAYGDLLAALSLDFERTFAGGPPDEEGHDDAAEEGWWDSFVVDPDLSLYPDHRKMDDSARWAMLKRALPSLERETYEDFLARNEKPAIPTFTSAGGKRIEVADRQWLKRIFAGPYVELNWERFHARYPHSTLVAFSAMGFSRDGRQGLVYVAFPGWYGSYYLLARDIGSWKIAEELEVWVS